MSGNSPTLARPVRATALTFAVLAALFAVCAPFVGVADPVVFFAAGLAYSLFLALFGVGLALAAAGRLARWWLLAAVVPLSLVASLGLGLSAAPEALLATPAVLWQGLMGVLLAWLAVGSALAGWGWVDYLWKSGGRT